jgi:hypothetical protein
VPGYLRRGRAIEIAHSLADGAGFSCHETTVDGDEDGTLVAGPDSQFCAGALILMEKSEEPNQAMRMAERLGLYDPARMDMSAPVSRSFAEFVDHHSEDGDETEDCCEVVEPGCEAPAGYLVGGSAIPADNTGVELHLCPECGRTVCESCSVEGVCSYCAEGAA